MVFEDHWQLPFYWLLTVSLLVANGGVPGGKTRIIFISNSVRTRIETNLSQRNSIKVPAAPRRPILQKSAVSQMLSEK